MAVWVALLFCFFLPSHGTAALAEDTFFFVAMGDSITSAFNTRWPYTINNSRYSWSTGESQRVPSHLSRLRMILSQRIEFENVARPSTTSSDLKGQLKQIKFERIDYLTLLTGGNDVCNWDDDHHADLMRFKENVAAVLEEVITTNRHIKIVIPAIPDMYHLYEIGKHKCRLRWDLLKICPRLLHSKRTPTERQRFHFRLTTANTVLKDLSVRYAAHVRFIPDIFNYKFSMEHTSHIDCFHPSVEGQSELSRVTWEKGWFSN